MTAISVDEIASAIIRGIEKAQTDYEVMSGGEWLWAASEYVLTTYIAREISAIDGPKFITIESHGLAAIVDAGAVVPGPKPRKARLRGRFDVLLWWANSKPRAVIEVKNQPGGPSGWFHDVERIASVLHISKGSTSIKFGALAYYYSAVDGKRYSAEEKIIRKLEAIEDHIKQNSKNLQIRQLYSQIHQEGDSAWVAVCLLIKARS
ncbi:hypothetical protein ACWKWZ_11550 [Metapseudomonas otitidis]